MMNDECGMMNLLVAIPIPHSSFRISLAPILQCNCRVPCGVYISDDAVDARDHFIHPSIISI